MLEHFIPFKYSMYLHVQQLLILIYVIQAKGDTSDPLSANLCEKVTVNSGEDVTLFLKRESDTKKFGETDNLCLLDKLNMITDKKRFFFDIHVSFSFLITFLCAQSNQSKTFLQELSSDQFDFNINIRVCRSCSEIKTCCCPFHELINAIFLFGAKAVRQTVMDQILGDLFPKLKLSMVVLLPH